jgi:hypothetical protein
MFGGIITICPEPQPNRITNDEDNYKSSIVKVKPGLLLITNKKMRIYSSPRHIAKPPVMCSPFCFALLECMSFVGMN